MRKLIFSLLMFVFGSSFCLKERLEMAHPGDYVVTESNKTISLLAIRSITPTTLLLEEITIPAQNLKNRPASWAEWIKQKAPGHTSWSMIEIDLENGQPLECYSFSKSAWIQMGQNESFLATLINLPMSSIEPDRQKKIGPAPLMGEPDFRKIWTPPLIFEGQKQKNVRFDVYETTWPKDESDLSNQTLFLYFDSQKQFPFPFWIQIQTSHATAALRVIDSGRTLPSIYRTIPRRVPEFVGLPIQTENVLRFNLKSPKYYKEFELFAVDVTGKKKQIFPIIHSLIEGEGERKTVEINLEELRQTLEANHRYTWLLVPIGHSESYTETRKPFVWLPNKL